MSKKKEFYIDIYLRYKKVRKADKLLMQELIKQFP